MTNGAIEKRVAMVAAVFLGVVLMPFSFTILFADGPPGTSFAWEMSKRIGIISIFYAIFGVGFGLAVPRLSWRLGLWLNAPNALLLLVIVPLLGGPGLLSLALLAAVIGAACLGAYAGARARRGRSSSKKVLAILSLAMLTVFAILFFGIGVFMAGSGPQPPEGVKSFENLSREHVEGEVSYDHIPPVGGDHWVLWQNCEFYEEPVRNETAVHSLERGSIWITYRPDLPQEQLEELKKYSEPGSDHVLFSPYPGLPAPVVASAWGKQLRLESAKDPRLQQFVDTFFLGPDETPEPQVTCDGGTSATVSEPVEEELQKARRPH